QLAYATGYEMKTVDLGTGKDLRKWPICRRVGNQLHAVYYTSLTWSPDGKLLAGSTNTVTNVWRASDSEQLHSFDAKDTFAPLRSLAFSADVKLLATGGNTPSVRDLTTGKIKSSVT